MVDFIKKRLQVFVSSTFSDLRSDRQAAVEAILSAGHIPAGMELFAAGDESQMEVIKQWIDESDVYLLILGGRYGSIDPKSGNSYTQLEYEYALSTNKPAFACVITEEALDGRVKKEGKDVLELGNPQKLKDFRAQVLTKISKFFSDPKDIKIAIIETLANLARREQLVGWVRANQQANVPAMADEVVRLSQENARLRTEIASMGRDILIGGIPFTDMKRLMSQKGILKFFTRHRRDFLLDGYRATVPIDEAALELQYLGLIRRMPGIDPPYFALTEAGKLCSIALESEGLKNSRKNKRLLSK